MAKFAIVATIVTILVLLVILTSLNNNLRSRLAMWSSMLWNRSTTPGSTIQVFPCRKNLQSLVNALMVYSVDHQDKLPPADKWCYVLVVECNIPQHNFICSGSTAQKGQSSYSINKYIVGRNYDELPIDTVILFDSKPGWNQIGGAEILAPENHGGTGCNIVLKDNSVKFYSTADFATLNWNISGEPNE
jgi:hypothetical protein